MTTLQEKIAVMQAFADGKTVEGRYANGSNEWGESINPVWDWSLYEYRVKPREWWINTYTTRQEAHDTKEAADDCASRSRIACIHVREVID